jgi:hypothetical protein
MDDEALVRRAFSAYYRSATRAAGHGVVNQPSSGSGVRHYDGKDYVVLYNVNGILAVYRIRTVNGQHVLKGLKRYPAALEALA